MTLIMKMADSLSEWVAIHLVAKGDGVQEGHVGSERCHISRLDSGAGSHLCMAETSNLPHPQLLKRRAGLHARIVLSSIDHTLNQRESSCPSAAGWVLITWHDSRADRMAHHMHQQAGHV